MYCKAHRVFHYSYNSDYHVVNWRVGITELAGRSSSDAWTAFRNVRNTIYSAMFTYLYRIVQFVVADEEVNCYFHTYLDEHGIKEMVKDSQEIDGFFPASLAEGYKEQESLLKSGETSVQMSKISARHPAHFIYFSLLLSSFLSLLFPHSFSRR